MGRRVSCGLIETKLSRKVKDEETARLAGERRIADFTLL
jgi:hypothetical protein